MEKIYLIKCSTYLHVASQLIKIENPERYAVSMMPTPSPLLYIYPSGCFEQINPIDDEEILPTRNMIMSAYTKNAPICYGIRLRDLQQDSFPYLYLAKTILSLRYPFSKATEIFDQYGEKYLILFN